MDNLTESIILQETNWNKVSTTLKNMLPNIEKVLVNPKSESLKKLAKKLAPRDLRFIEQDAIRRIPGFKKEYMEAQGKVGKLKFVNNYNAIAAAMATAIVSSTSKKRKEVPPLRVIVALLPSMVMSLVMRGSPFLPE